MNGHGKEIPAALWKVVQSVDEIHPAFEPSATVQPMAKPDPMIDCPAVAVIPPVDVTVPVATVPSVDGVPMPVQYESCPATSDEEVETLPVPVLPVPAVPFEAEMISP